MTPAQNAIIKAYIQSVPELNNAPTDGDGLGLIRDALNAQASPAFYVWRSSTPAADIGNAVVWSALTPLDSPDATVIYTNRALLCQAKQINIQTLIQGRDSVASNKPSIRSGLQDALTNIPSGASGASLGGGWNAVKTAMTRTTSVLEHLLATGTGTAATPADLGFEGNIDNNGVDTARRS